MIKDYTLTRLTADMVWERYDNIELIEMSELPRIEG